jgi:hypothetical protein
MQRIAFLLKLSPHGIKAANRVVPHAQQVAADKFKRNMRCAFA